MIGLKIVAATGQHCTALPTHGARAKCKIQGRLSFERDATAAEAAAASAEAAPLTLVSLFPSFRSIYDDADGPRMNRFTQSTDHSDTESESGTHSELCTHKNTHR